VAGNEQQAIRYEKPSVVDYGSLVELTALNGMVDAEDGVGKLLHTDGSDGFIP
jgi:hypothetical protein